jgi:hypothetical protein
MSNENNSLVRRQLETSLQLGNLSDLMKATEQVMLLIDTSGSMAGRPIEQLRKVVTQIQTEGTVPMIAFGGPFDAQVRFVDRVPEPDGGTPLHSAIPFAREYGATRLVVISDGLPDLPGESLEQAKQFGGRIDVVYVGHAGDGGAKLLEELAKLTGGTRLQGDLSDVKKLASTVIGLLEGEVGPTRSPIQGAGFTSEAVDPLDVDDDDTDDADEDFDEEDEDEDDDADGE